MGITLTVHSNVDHTDAINMMRSEVGRLKSMLDHANWAHLRKRTLERIANVELTIAFLEKVRAQQ